MATTPLTASRRAFISSAGAICAVSALPAVALASCNPRTAWDAAMARLVKADAVAFGASNAAIEAGTKYRKAFVPRPEGLTMFGNGRSFTMEEARANMKAEQEAWRAQDKALSRRFGMDDMRRAHEDANDEKCAAESALLAMPAPDRAALIWKIERWAEIMDEDAMRPMLADGRRLLGDA